MADIAKCSEESCELKETCYRYTSEANIPYQWYFCPEATGEECEYYLQAKTEC